MEITIKINDDLTLSSKYIDRNGTEQKLGGGFVNINFRGHEIQIETKELIHVLEKF